MTGQCRDVPWRVSTKSNINQYFIDNQNITTTQTTKPPHPTQDSPQILRLHNKPSAKNVRL